METVVLLFLIFRTFSLRVMNKGQLRDDEITPGIRHTSVAL